MFQMRTITFCALRIIQLAHKETEEAKYNH